MKRSLRSSFLICLIATFSISLSAQNPQFQTHEYRVGAAARSVDKATSTRRRLRSGDRRRRFQHRLGAAGAGAREVRRGDRFRHRSGSGGVIAVDVNHDGKLDIVTVNHDPIPSPSFSVRRRHLRGQTRHPGRHRSEFDYGRRLQQRWQYRSGGRQWDQQDHLGPSRRRQRKLFRLRIRCVSLHPDSGRCRRWKFFIHRLDQSRRFQCRW